jgi:hypothetical protein
MRTFVIALALLATSAVPALAQVGSGPGFPTDNPIPGSKLASPATPNPEFPLHVWLHLGSNAWEGDNEYYIGYGRFQIASAAPATPAKPMHFEYECGVTFRDPAVNQFQARWLKPNKTLQILLYDPERPSKPRTCNISALAHPLPRTSRALSSSNTINPVPRGSYNGGVPSNGIPTSITPHP